MQHDSLRFLTHHFIRDRGTANFQTFEQKPRRAVPPARVFVRIEKWPFLIKVAVWSSSNLLIEDYLSVDSNSYDPLSMMFVRIYIYAAVGIVICCGLFINDSAAQRYRYTLGRPQLPNQISPASNTFRANLPPDRTQVAPLPKTLPLTVPGHLEKDTRRPRPPAKTVAAVVESDNERKQQADTPGYSLYPRMIAEFEPQRAIALSVSDLKPQHRHVLKQIILKSHGHAEFLILYNDNQQLKTTVDLLNGVPTDHVSFYRLKLDTIWLRDFGPRIVEELDGTRAVDFFYHGIRPYDDSFPERWGLETNGKLTKVPWTLQGGNLICNGQGLGIATSRIFEDNQVSIGSRSNVPSVSDQGKLFVWEQIKTAINLQALVVLQPLQNESTKHVDMFAAFIAPDHALVADLGPSRSTNAKILDYNAGQLKQVKIDGKPLRVDRIRIPKPQGNAWSTYTNAIFTDRLVLMPVMKTDPKPLIQAAIAKYRKFLPNHHVDTVDITSMKDLQGSLHCLSINIPAQTPLPKGTINYSEAKSIAERTPQPAKNPNQTTARANHYSMDEQLRRIFKSSTHDYLVDAYAVALQDNVITLMRADNRKLIRVKTTGVCQTDQYWINRNGKKIQQNGSNVRRVVTSR